MASTKPSAALVRAFWLQGVRGDELRAEARGQQVTKVTIPGQRGRVLDRNARFDELRVCCGVDANLGEDRLVVLAQGRRERANRSGRAQ